MSTDWISVERMLPQVGNLVLVTDGTGMVACKVAYLMVDGQPKYELPGITHWMPQPELPR